MSARLVITGGAGGLGQAVAAELAKRGDRALLVDRDAEGLERVSARLGHAHCAADLTRADDRARVRHWVEQHWGALDGLVNAAGVISFGLQDAVDDDQVERVMAINLVAPILLTRALLPLLERGTHPVIVNVGSVFGHIGFPGFSLYSASKFGLHGFTETLRRELSGGPVKVAWISPRATRTAMNAGPVDRLNAALNVRYDEPEVVARAVAQTLRRPRRDRVLGFPEKLFARINQLLPSVVDRSLSAQLPTIREHSHLLKEHSR